MPLHVALSSLVDTALSGKMLMLISSTFSTGSITGARGNFFLLNLN